MGLFDNWPYSDVHQLNLDWILKVIKEIKGKTDEIDAAVETAQQEAEAASQSEINAAAAKDDAVTAAGQAQNFYNQILYLTGSAVVANTAADMTDTDKVYIYVGSETGYETNHWYYYDGSVWVDGGLYGAGSAISTNAINLLRYVLDRVAYTEQGMNVYVEALCRALAENGGQPTNTYSIINALSYVTNSNNATGIDEGESYNATLTADPDYTIDSVTVTMGGVDVTSAVYSNGTITITSVTGDIVITATAVAVGPLPSGYTQYDYLALNYSDGTAVTGNSRAIIFSDLSLSANYTYEFEVYAEDVTTGTGSNTAQAILGARAGASGDKLFGVFYTPNATKIGYWLNGTDTATTINAFTKGSVNTIRILPVGASETYPNNVVIEVNGTEYNSGSTDHDVIYSSYMAFFKYAISASAVNSSTQYYYGVRIGRFTVKNGNTVVYDFIPVNNGTYYGYYERITEQFSQLMGFPEYCIGGNWS